MQASSSTSPLSVSIRQTLRTNVAEKSASVTKHWPAILIAVNAIQQANRNSVANNEPEVFNLSMVLGETNGLSGTLPLSGPQPFQPDT